MATKDSEKRGKWQDDAQGKWKKTRPQPAEPSIEVPKPKPKAPTARENVATKAPKRKIEEEEKAPVFQQKPLIKVKKPLAIKDEEPAEKFTRKYKSPLGKFAKRKPPRRVEPIPREITEIVDEGRAKKFIKRSADVAKVAKTALASIAQKSMDAVRQHVRNVASTVGATPTARIMQVMAQRMASNPRAVKGYKSPGLRVGRRTRR